MTWFDGKHSEDDNQSGTGSWFRDNLNKKQREKARKDKLKTTWKNRRSWLNRSW